MLICAWWTTLRNILMHVNLHRHDEEASTKTEWNYLLLRHVIAPCYVALLRDVPRHINMLTNTPNLSFTAMDGEQVSVRQ